MSSVYGTAKIERPPRWISVTLTVLLVILIFFGFTFARYYDLQAKWSQPVELRCESESVRQNELVQLGAASATIVIPPKKCWSEWFIAPNHASGIWFGLPFPPNLTIFWHYTDGTTFKQGANDPYLPVGKQVDAAKYYNNGSEPITLSITFND
jgi:hypothetical protein